MDMRDKRLKGEENLSKKLDQLDLGFDDADIQQFENLLDKPKNSNLSIVFLKTLGLILILGFSVLLVSRSFSKTYSDEEKLMSSLEGIVHDQNVENLDGNDEEQNDFVKRTKVLAEKGLIKSIPNTNLPSKEIELLAHQDVQKRNENVDPLERQKETNEEASNVEINYVISSETTGVGTSNIFNNNLSSEKGESTSLLVHSSASLDLYMLPLLHMDLESGNREIIGFSPKQSIQNKIIQPFKRVSFGFQFQRGRTHPAAHDTPFVSPFETSIAGLESFEYGIFGQINLDQRIAIRSSFTYSKIGHQQTVHGLRFNETDTDLILEVDAHEVKFGLDYSYNLLPKFNGLDIRPGVGISYSNVISTESNNYYTELEDEEGFANASELSIKPFSYTVFLAFEKKVYKNMVVGVEPFLTYQKRTANYTPSIFIADSGNYNLQSGLNLTCRF